MGNPNKHLLGYDVGGTKSAAVIATFDGRVVDRVEWASDVAQGPDAMIAQFLQHARRLIAARAGADPGGGPAGPIGAGGSIAGVGVSIGGPMDSVRGVILSPPHLPGWDDIPLADILRRELALSVVVEHDAAACLEAEVLWGAAVGATHAAYLTCGTGCGAGLLVDGRIIRGPRGQSPELGHVRLAADGPEAFGKRGCVESFCSGSGIAKLAGWMFPSRWSGPVSTSDLHDLHQAGDADASAVLAESALRTGQLCAIIADAFAPQVILLGSLARYLGDWWVQLVRRQFALEALATNAAGTRIIPAGLGSRLQDLSSVAPYVFKESFK